MITTLFTVWLRRLLIAALLWAVGSSHALAGLTVTSVTIGNVPAGTTAYVTPGSVITVNVTVTLTNGTRWWSTAITTSPTSTMNFCTTGPDVAYTGSRTYSFNVTAPNSQALYELVVAAHSNNNCNNGGERGTRRTAAALDTRPAPVAGLDHIRLEHDGIGRTCGPKAVTIKACANATCTTLFTASTAVALTATNSGSWGPPTSVTFTGGSTTAQLSKTASGTVTMGGSVTSPTPKSNVPVCVNSGVAGSCDIVFSPSACSVDAVETGRAPATPIFTKSIGAGFKLDVLSLNGSGALANSTATIKARLVDEASCVGTNPTLTFLSPEVSGQFSGSRLAYTFVPERASRSARVRIVNGTQIGCSSDKFAIRPALFSIATVASGGAGADPSGTSPSASPAIKAGNTAFTLTATAFAGYDGKPAISNDRLAAADVNTGVPGSAGVLDTDFTNGGFATASGGVSSGLFKYSEVGYVKLLPFAVYDDGAFTVVDGAKGECFSDGLTLAADAAVPDPNIVNASGMIGCYFGNTESPYFGRFIPDRFIASALTLTNRSNVAGCTASTFTYLGEQMLASATLTAVNANGELTSNYRGIFNRFNAPATQLGLGVINEAPVTGTRTAFPPCAATPAGACMTVGTGTAAVTLGEAKLTAALTLFRPDVASGPYDGVKVGIAPADLDLVRLDPTAYDIDTVTVPTAAASNRLLVDSTRARYGRMNIDNAYGSELLNLSVRVSAQYYNSNGYAANLLDSCTPVTAAGFTILPVSYRGGLGPANMPLSNISASSVMNAGVGKVVLKKPFPVPTAKGSVELRSISTILPGSGRQTFGLYKAGPVIYMRETY